jgi:uncharacterized protein (DUF2062 family)
MPPPPDREDAAGPPPEPPAAPRRAAYIFSPGDARRWLVRLAGSSEPPERIAAAFAVGVFIGFSPFLGLQTLSALAAAVAFRLNRAAVLVGLVTNLPWVMVPWYLLTTTAGAAVLDVPLQTDFGARLQQLLGTPVYQGAFWQRAVELLWPLLGAFLLGSTIGAAAMGGLAYVAMVRVLRRVGKDSG